MALPIMVSMCFGFSFERVHGQTALGKGVGAFLKNYCTDCHGETDQNAQLRFDRIKEFRGKDQTLWAKIHHVVSSKEMPPVEYDQPSPNEIEEFTKWIELASSKEFEAGSKRRRLNRREFSAALKDLTGLPIDFGAGLAEDGRVDGFDTGSAALLDAADTVDQMLEVSRRAVESIRFHDSPKKSVYSIDFLEQEFNDFRKFVEKTRPSETIFTKSKRLRSVAGTGLFLPTQWSGDRGSSFLALPAPEDKNAAFKISIRVKAYRPLKGLPLPMLWVKIGGKYVDYVSIDDKSQTLTYAVRLEDHVVENGVVKIMLQSFVEMPYAVDGFENDDRSKPEDKIPGGIGIYRPRFDKKKLRTPDVQPLPSIVLEQVEIDYDHQAKWPPKHWNIPVKDFDDDDSEAKQLIKIWIERAWRREVSSNEVQRYVALYRELTEKGKSFDQSLRVVFQSALMGAGFRYQGTPADKNDTVSQFAIASRLSFMLTGGPPDEVLRNLAAQGKLKQRNVLDQQVDRLLADEKSIDFFQPFVSQWLSLGQPITQTMSHFQKQEFRFGRHLKSSLKAETIEYIRQIFQDNRPARELVQSDWTMMNDILSWYYGQERLVGGQLRKVKFRTANEDLRGGGILGHAGIQSMLCWMGDNWVIYRGAWAADRILDDPPPPPPLEVPELNPSDGENRGKSFRELLIQHQKDKNCAVCHRKIDPLGFAFQNFDLSGRWRNVEHERYRRKELDGKIEWRGEGKTRAVDTAGKLPKGESFETFREFKTLLADNYLDNIVLGLMKKLTLYGTGRTANVNDIATIKQIMKKYSRDGYRLGDLLKALVRSRVFLDGMESR